MTREEFSRWIEERGKRGRTHYEELIAVAFERTRTSEVPLTDRQGRPLDIGQAEAEATVQGAVTRALDSPTLAELDPAKAWPWMVDAVSGVVSNARRGARRASRAHRQWAGAFHFEHGTNRGTHTQPALNPDDKPDGGVEEANATGRGAVAWPQRGSGRIVAHDPDHNDDENGHDFVGPRGAWKGEDTVAHLGPCGSCRGGVSWSRLELGRDRERLGYSKRWMVDVLANIEGAIGSVSQSEPDVYPGWKPCPFCVNVRVHRLRRPDGKKTKGRECPKCRVAFHPRAWAAGWVQQWQGIRGGYTRSNRALVGGIERLAGYALACIAQDAATRTVYRTFQVLGCWNGHRVYTGEMP